MADFYSTAGVDRFVGGKEDDYFVFYSGYMTKTDKVDGGGGKNALVLLNDIGRVWTVTPADWPAFSKIKGIVLVSRSYDGSDAGGFSLTFDNGAFKTNKVSSFVVDASGVGVDQGRLHLKASAVTNMAFDIYGSSGLYNPTFEEEQASYDSLTTGSKNDRFVYHANSLIDDWIDGGAGADTIVLVGAGRTATTNGKEVTDPNGFTTLQHVKNVENVVITDLAAGQTRTIDFGLTSKYRGRNTIEITTDQNYGTGKTAAAVDGKLIVDGTDLKLVTNVLNIKGGNAADILIGGAADDNLSGGKGNDIIVGGYGSDRLYGNQGDDIFYNYIVYSVGGHETIGSASGKFGDDSMFGGEGNDTFIFWIDNPKATYTGEISGGSGTDTLKLAGYKVPKGKPNITGIEVLDFQTISFEFKVSHDFLRKNHDENGRLLIQNGAGKSRSTIELDASGLIDAKYSVHVAIRSPGKETLTGGMGNDVFDYSLINKRLAESGVTGSDIITGGDGVDTILTAEGHKTVLGRSTTGVENFRVVSISDTGSKTDIIIGVTEAMTIDGGRLHADDTLIAQGYYKNIQTGNVVEAKGSLLIIGGRGDDIIIGGRANDRLRGGDGDDMLTGGKGADRLAGGKGADHFIFAAAADSPPGASERDFITDFHRYESDKIKFVHEGKASYSFIGSNALHGKAGEVQSYISGSNTYVKVDIDGDGIADIGFGIAGKITLTQSDFIL